MKEEHRGETKTECGIRCEDQFNDCVERQQLDCMEDYDRCRSSCEDKPI